MDLSAISPVLLIASLMTASTPILLAAMGEMIAEKSGVLNLGVEGMMITGAICGFAVAVETGSPVLGFVGAAVGGAALSLDFRGPDPVFPVKSSGYWSCVDAVRAWISSLIGQGYVGIKPPASPKLDLPVLSEMPVVGPILFSHDPLIYFSIALVFAVGWALKRTRAGLILRAVAKATMPRTRWATRSSVSGSWQSHSVAPAPVSAAPTSAWCGCRNGPKA